MRACIGGRLHLDKLTKWPVISGHETTFAGLLFCLARLGALQKEDAPALVLSVFPAYLALMHRLQTTYWLEPAGSHGVWGLDDYQFLPFLWGSAQVREVKGSVLTSIA